MTILIYLTRLVNSRFKSLHSQSIKILKIRIDIRKLKRIWRRSTSKTRLLKKRLELVEFWSILRLVLIATFTNIALIIMKPSTNNSMSWSSRKLRNITLSYMWQRITLLVSLPLELLRSWVENIYYFRNYELKSGLKYHMCYPKFRDF